MPRPLEAIRYRSTSGGSDRTAHGEIIPCPANLSARRSFHLPFPLADNPASATTLHRRAKWIPDAGECAASGTSQTSHRRYNLNLAGCRAGNIAPRSPYPRNPARHFAEDRETRDPEIAKPARAAGLHIRRKPEAKSSGIESFPHIAEFRKPSLATGELCPRQAASRRAVLQPGRPFCCRSFPSVSRFTAR